MSTYKWWRGQRWQQYGLSRGHKSKLRRQCLGEPLLGAAAQRAHDADVLKKMQDAFSACTTGGTQPDIIWVSDQVLEELGVQ